MKFWITGFFFVATLFLALSAVADSQEHSKPTMTDDNPEISHGQVSITMNSATVKRGNHFSVTITGNPHENIYFWVQSHKSGLPGEQPPMIIDGQEGVSHDPASGPYLIGEHKTSSGERILDLVAKYPDNGVLYYTLITTDNDGRRIVELKTTANTDDSNYKLKIEAG